MDNIHISTTNIEDSHESETHTPMEFQSNSFRFPIVNGLFRRAQSLHRQPSSPSRFADSIYKECLKNHVARRGGFALDGCGGYIACPSSPLSLKCEVCGCHRNFHRCQSKKALEYPIFYHAPPPPLTPGNSLSPNYASPPPLLPSFHPPPPHIVGTPNNVSNANNVQMEFQASSSGIKKRYRTKFSSEQKVKMLELAERVGWKMQKTEKEMIETFCREIGVQRSVLKIWIQNHKNTLGKRSDAIGVDCRNEDNVGLHFDGTDDVLGQEENVVNASPSSFF